MRKRITRLLAVAAVTAMSSTAHAAIYDFPLADNAFISKNGLDWAWAGPCSPVGPSCGPIDLTFQSTFGWHLPSIAEFAQRPAPSEFLFGGANVPQGGVDPLSLSRFGDGNDNPIDVGSDGACAAAYFGTTHRHCDYGDAVLGGIWDPALGESNNSLSEAWVVREQVPEPASGLLLLSGLGLVRAYRRKH